MTISSRQDRIHLGRAFFAAIVVLLISACSSSTPLIADQLDPVTGVTVTRSTVPLVLYRDNSAQAAYARDFVYVGPLQINRMGEYSHFLWLGIWSSLAGQDVSNQRDGFDSIVIFADGEPLRLELQGWTLASIGVSETIYDKPTASAADAYYAVTMDQIRVIAQARDIRLRSGETRAESYEPWDSQTRALSAMRAYLDRLAY
jgi:hypothetical protein